MTKKQAQILDFIKRYQQTRGGVTPSYEEITLGCGYSPLSKSAVHRIIHILIREGHLVMRPHAARTIRVVNTPAPLTYAPLYVKRGAKWLEKNGYRVVTK